MKYGQQRATQGATIESREHKGNATMQKIEESKKKCCTSKVMCNEVGITPLALNEPASKSMLRHESGHQKGVKESRR